jgi:ribonuclease-3
MDTSPYAPLQQALGWTFRDASLLVQSLTHRSYCAEHPEVPSNERFEFLGDAVLGLVVTDEIFTRFPHLPEGELAKLRAAVVNSETLADVATGIDLGAHLLLGKGEDSTGGRTKSSILADAMEAVFAAVYLDGGRDAAEPVILSLLSTRISDEASGPGGQDFKTRLQELAARRFEHLPRYRLRDEGPDHDKRFYASVSIGGVVRGDGEGRSKKQAEQAAAQAAWQWLRELDEDAAEGRVTGESADLVTEGSKERPASESEALASSGGGTDAGTT